MGERELLVVGTWVGTFGSLKSLHPYQLSGSADLARYWLKVALLLAIQKPQAWNTERIYLKMDTCLDWGQYMIAFANKGSKG